MKDGILRDLSVGDKVIVFNDNYIGAYGGCVIGFSNTQVQVNVYKKCGLDCNNWKDVLPGFTKYYDPCKTLICTPPIKSVTW